MKPHNGPVPLVARGAILGAIACALYIPLWDGARDFPAFAMVVALAALGLLASGLRERGPSAVASWLRVAMMLAGLGAIGVYEQSAKQLFPPGNPLASPAILALFWTLVVSCLFLFLPEGPMSVFVVSGALMLVSAFVDYGSAAVTPTFLFVFFAILHDLAAAHPEPPPGERSSEHYGPVLELAVAVSGVAGAVTLVFYLTLPLVLPHVDIDEIARRIEDQAAARGEAERLKYEKARPGLRVPGGPQTKPVLPPDPNQPLDAGNGLPPPDIVLFRIESPVTHHFRLRTYRVFDGRRWLPEASPSSAAGIISPDRPLELFDGGGRTPVQQVVTVIGWISGEIPAIYPAGSVKGADGPLQLGADWSIALGRQLGRGESYTVDSYPGTSPAAERSRGELSSYLQVPVGVSGRVRAIAAQLGKKASGPEARIAIDAEYLARNCKYKWTYGSQTNQDAVDRFLFDEKQGNCTSFASAMAILLRLQDVPARFVAGFGGGDLDVKGGLVVSARHAHAWVEAWTGDVWRSVDAVPPEANPAVQAAREVGEEPRGPDVAGTKQDSMVDRPPSRQEMARGEGKLGPPPANRSEAWLGAMRQKTRAAADGAAETARRHWIWSLLLAGLPVLVGLAGVSRLGRVARFLARFLRRGRGSLLTAAQERDFLEKLSAKGLVRLPWETLFEFLERLREEEKAPRSLAPLIDLAVRVRYSGLPPDRKDRELAKRLLDELDADLATL